jgi:hypothetical protein
VYRNSRGFFEALVGDGRALVALSGVCLGLSGLFAILQSATGHFLPHDTAFLAMTAEDLCGMHECRIVHFMFHDRVSFGGSLVALAALYLWLADAGGSIGSVSRTIDTAYSASARGKCRSLTHAKLAKLAMGLSPNSELQPWQHDLSRRRSNWK